jgi:hypothetical protein
MDKTSLTTEWPRDTTAKIISKFEVLLENVHQTHLIVLSAYKDDWCAILYHICRNLILGQALKKGDRI